MRALLVPIVVSLLAGTAEAQLLGYVVAGPAGTSPSINSLISFHAAAGGELVADRVGVGGELGLFYRFVTGSVNGTLQLGRVSSRKTTPFVTAGYSGLWRTDGESAFRGFNVGAGVDM